MSRERELEKFVKGAFFDGFLIGYDTGANDGAPGSEEEKKELEKIAHYGAGRYWKIRFMPRLQEYRRLMDRCFKEAFNNKKGGANNSPASTK